MTPAMTVSRACKITLAIVACDLRGLPMTHGQFQFKAYPTTWRPGQFLAARHRPHPKPHNHVCEGITDFGNNWHKSKTKMQYNSLSTTMIQIYQGNKYKDHIKMITTMVIIKIWPANCRSQFFIRFSLPPKSHMYIWKQTVLIVLGTVVIQHTQGALQRTWGLLQFAIKFSNCRGISGWLPKFA